MSACVGSSNQLRERSRTARSAPSVFSQPESFTAFGISTSSMPERGLEPPTRALPIGIPYSMTPAKYRTISAPRDDISASSRSASDNQDTDHKSSQHVNTWPELKFKVRSELINKNGRVFMSFSSANGAGNLRRFRIVLALAALVSLAACGGGAGGGAGGG